MRRICVFCGSSSGRHPQYRQAAQAFAKVLARRGIGLVYGGASVGLMGEIANTVLAEGGEVVGVIPRILVDREIALRNVTDLRVVDSMHERKALMGELSDGFVALPGGFGTLDELFEVLTWAQIGLHGKPCGLFNILNYYDKLLSFLDWAVEQQFVRPSHREKVFVTDDPEALISQLDSYLSPVVGKWDRSHL